MKFFNVFSTSNFIYKIPDVKLEYLLYFIPAFVISVIALIFLKKVIARGYKVKSKGNMTGADAANLFLEKNNCDDIAVVCTNKKTHANFDLSTKTICLSNQTYYNNALSSIAIATLEATNASRISSKLLFPLIKYILNPVIQIVSAFSLPAIIIGLVFSMGELINISMLMFSGAVLLSFILIPYELFGAKVAYDMLRRCGILLPYELKILKKVLFISSISYTASTFTALWSIVKAVVGFLGKGVK